MADEGRLIDPAEARIRKALRNKKLAERPRVRVSKVHISPIDRETREYTFTVKTPKSEVNAVVSRFPEAKNQLYVSHIVPSKHTSEKITGMKTGPKSLSGLHPLVKNKVLTPTEIKQSLYTISKMFPTVDQVVGHRITGSKAKEGVARAARAYRQSIKLPKSGKVGKALGLGAALYQAYKGPQ